MVPRERERTFWAEKCALTEPVEGEGLGGSPNFFENYKDLLKKITPRSLSDI